MNPNTYPVMLLGGPMDGIIVPWDESALAMRVRRPPYMGSEFEPETYIRVEAELALWGRMPEAREGA